MDLVLNLWRVGPAMVPLHNISFLRFPPAAFRPLNTSRSILKARGQRTADTISVEKMFMGPTTRRKRGMGGGSGIKCRSEIFLWVNALHVGKGIPTLARICRTDLNDEHSVEEKRKTNNGLQR